MNVNEYTIANRYLRLIQPYDVDFYIHSPSSVEESFVPLLYSQRRCVSVGCNRSLDSLPGQIVGTIPDSAHFEVKISSVRLFKGPDNDTLIVCLSKDNTTMSARCSLVVKPLSDRVLSWTLVKSTGHYIFAMFPIPQSFHDVHLQINTSDWIIHLRNPLDLDSIRPYAEAMDRDRIEDVSDITHPWKIRLKIGLEEDRVEKGLMKLFGHRLAVGEWINVRQGLFSDCLVRLIRNSAGELDLEALSRHRNVHYLLIDRLKYDGFSVSQEDGQGLESEPVTPNDLRNALLTELRLLKSALCGPLIRHVMQSNLPLVTESLPKISSALQIAGIIANWKEVAGGSKPIDRSAVAGVVGERSVGAIAAACATTNSIINRLSS